VNIGRAEVLVLSHRLSRTRYFSTGSNTTRDAVVVRLEDTDGRVGWGETYLVPGALEAARELVRGLVGVDAEAAATRLAETGAAHRWALSAVAIALDDLRARQRRIPVAALYGEPHRTRVEAYASSAGYVEGEDPAVTWSREAAAVRASGFRSFKLRIGRTPLERELPAIRSAVAGVPGLTWMADGNGAYEDAGARRLGVELGDLGFAWLEEPLPTADYAAYAPLRHDLTLPIAGGETIERPEVASAHLARGCFDIVQPDVSICGGIEPVLRIAAAAAERGVACVPHSCNGAIGLAATLQVLALLPARAPTHAADPMLEHDVGENPIRTDLLCDPIGVDGTGTIRIPTGPGLGIEVDEAAVRRLASP
jgi:D-galactarolactone cycloisomerase